MKIYKIIFFLGLVFAAVSVQAQTRYEVTHVSATINTTGSETGAVLVDDSLLFYTTMQSQQSSRIDFIDFNPVLT